MCLPAGMPLHEKSNKHCFGYPIALRALILAFYPADLNLNTFEDMWMARL
jgi:hypothetical protein